MIPGHSYSTALLLVACGVRKAVLVEAFRSPKEARAIADALGAEGLWPGCCTVVAIAETCVFIVDPAGVAASWARPAALGSDIAQYRPCIVDISGASPLLLAEGSVDETFVFDGIARFVELLTATARAAPTPLRFWSAEALWECVGCSTSTTDDSRSRFIDRASGSPAGGIAVGRIAIAGWLCGYPVLYARARSERRWWLQQRDRSTGGDGGAAAAAAAVAAAAVADTSGEGGAVAAVEDVADMSVPALAPTASPPTSCLAQEPLSVRRVTLRVTGLSNDLLAAPARASPAACSSAASSSSAAAGARVEASADADGLAWFRALCPPPPTGEGEAKDASGQRPGTVAMPGAGQRTGDETGGEWTTVAAFGTRRKPAAHAPTSSGRAHAPTPDPAARAGAATSEAAHGLGHGHGQKMGMGQSRPQPPKAVSVLVWSFSVPVAVELAGVDVEDDDVVDEGSDRALGEDRAEAKAVAARPAETQASAQTRRRALAALQRSCRNPRIRRAVAAFLCSAGAVSSLLVTERELASRPLVELESVTREVVRLPNVLL